MPNDLLTNDPLRIAYISFTNLDMINTSYTTMQENEHEKQNQLKHLSQKNREQQHAQRTLYSYWMIVSQSCIAYICL